MHDGDRDAASHARAMRAPRERDAFATALCVIVAFRALGAIVNATTFDCDEAFNYWEPLHALTHGHGLQTWEHGSAYALRSYAYLFLHYAPVRAARWALGEDAGRAAFACGRGTLGLASACAEAALVSAVRARKALVGSVLMMILATSSGMAIASTAMLPSSFAMTCVTAACAATLRGEHRRACVACVVAVVFGWPFSGIAVVPFGLCAVHAIGFWAVFWCVVAATAISAAISVACDTYMYNDISRSGGWKIVSSVYNLLKYNVASGKSDLYGTESATFYAKNLALNFQLAAALAIFAPFAVALAVAVKALRMRKLLKTKKCDAKTALAEIRAYRNNWRAMIAVCSPFPIVTAFFTWIPHKEERFLYMIYPCLCLSAAITVGALAESALGLNAHAFGKSRVVKLGVVVGVCGCVLTVMVLSLSRTAALLQYYGAPAKIYHALPMPSSRANGNAWPAWLAEEFAAGGDDATVDVCVGDEWYRFPSSYHFPSNKYRLRFLKAGFDGALPMPFDFSKGGTAHTPEGLNDDNRAHPNQYVDPSSCRFLVEAEFERGNAHSASKDFVPGEWIDVAVEKFIDPSRSPTLTRVFYIPGYSEKKNAYVDYKLKRRARAPTSPTDA